MGTKRWTIGDLLKVSTEYLIEKGIETARLDAEVLLAHQLGSDRVSLYLNLDQPLAEAEIAGYRAAIRRRLAREPLPYITGVREFWSLEMQVGAETLIPRPESELLVEQAIRLLKAAQSTKARPLRLLELGTGSGALAVALARELEGAIIWATDISPAPIETARINSETHGVAGQIHFLVGDLLEPLADPGPGFDVILSNPPYVAVEEYDALPQEVRDYEPRLALDGGKGGMYYVERIIAQAPYHLTPGGWLLIEMAPQQTEAALGLVDRAGAYGQKQRIKDYGRHYRIVIAQRA